MRIEKIGMLALAAIGVQFCSCSMDKKGKENGFETTQPLQKAMLDTVASATEAFPLEIIENHKQKELAVDFIDNPLIEDEFEYSFETYFLHVLIVKTGAISGSQYNGGQLYRIDQYDDGKGEPGFRVNRMIKFQNTLILLSQNSDGSIGKGVDANFEVDEELQLLLKTELFRGVEKVIDNKDAHIASLDVQVRVEITANTYLELKQRRVEYREDFHAIFKNLLKPIGIVEGEVLLYGEKEEAHSLLNSQDNRNNGFWNPNEEGGIWMFQPDGLILNYSYECKDALVEAMPAMKDFRIFNRYACGNLPHQMAKVLRLGDKDLEDIAPTQRIDDTLVLYQVNNDSSQILKNAFELYTECFNDVTYNWNDHLKPPLSFQDFIESTPLFIVKDPFGRFIQFTRQDYILQPACEPVIYIYSSSQKEYQIKLGSKITPLSTYPPHHPKEGWLAKGNHNGSITMSGNGRNHKYLFWEGSSVYLPAKTDGFIVHFDTLDVFFSETLSKLGLNENEIQDFTEYWVPQFDSSDEYYRISFYTQALIDQLFPLEITPKPMQVIRILMDYEGIGKERVDWARQELVPVERMGDELIIEWGGIKRPEQRSNS